MPDAYYDRPDELARFYADQYRQDAGAKAETMVGFHIRDAEATNDERRAEFWRKVQDRLTSK